MLNSFFYFKALEKSSMRLNIKMVDPKLDESFTNMESVSEDVLDFLGFEGFALFVNPVYHLFDANQVLPFVQ